MARKHRVDLSPVAEQDIEEAYTFLVERAPEASERWINSLERAVVTLERMPVRCPRIPEMGGGGPYRHLMLGQYRLIFRIRGRKVIVVRIIHRARLLDTEALN